MTPLPHLAKNTQKTICPKRRSSVLKTIPYNLTQTKIMKRGAAAPLGPAQ